MIARSRRFLAVSASLMAAPLAMPPVAHALTGPRPVVTRVIGEGDEYGLIDQGFGPELELVDAVNGVTANPRGGFATRIRSIVTFNNTGFAALFGSPNAPDTGQFLIEEVGDSVTQRGLTFQRIGFNPDPSFNDAGQLGYDADVDITAGGSGTDLDSVWVDDELIALEGDAVPPSTGFDGGSFTALRYVGLDRAGTAFFTATYSGAGGGVGLFAGPDTVLLRTGDTLANVSRTVTGDSLFGISGPAISSNATHYVARVTTDAGDTLVRSGAALLDREGEPLTVGTLLPVADGGDGATIAWESFADPVVNEAGRWAATGFVGDPAVSGDSTDVVLIDGRVALAEGDTVPTVDGAEHTLAGSATAAAVNDAGDVAVLFSDDAGADGNAVLLNGRLIVGIDSPIADSDDSVQKVQRSLAMSNRNAAGEVTIYFIGRDATGFGAFGDTIYSLTVLAGVPGDFDGDGDDDAFDLGIWQTGFGTAEAAMASDGDADFDGDVDAFDLGLWQVNFGTTADDGAAAVPTPAALSMLLVGVPLLGRRRSGSGRSPTG